MRCGFLGVLVLGSRQGSGGEQPYRNYTVFPEFNFILDVPYWQISLTPGSGGYGSDPVHGPTAYCVATCDAMQAARGRRCEGFFYQRHHSGGE